MWFFFVYFSKWERAEEHLKYLEVKTLLSFPPFTMDYYTFASFVKWCSLGTFSVHSREWVDGVKIIKKINEISYIKMCTFFFFFSIKSSIKEWDWKCAWICFFSSTFTNCISFPFIQKGDTYFRLKSQKPHRAPHKNV